MTQFPGFPSNGFDFHFEEAGGALAGLMMRDRNGDVVPGILAHTDTLLTPGSGWTLKVSPFVAARSKGRAVLLGGSTEEVILDVDPSPSANSRIDVVYSLPADVESGDPVKGVSVAKGTPGAAPAKPSIPSGAIEIGTFRTTAGHTGAAQAQINETFTFAALHGTVVKVRSKTLLSGLNLSSGSKAFIMDEGVTVELLGSQWLVGKSVPYSPPFKAYGPGTPSIEVSVDNGMVTVYGVAGTTQPADLVGSVNRLVGNIGDSHAPRKQLVVVMQGSGVSRWTLIIEPDGRVLANRYSPETPTNSVWLPFSVSYPAKR